MAWGAAATGTRAATGSTGQGLSLMQESLAEIDARAAPARRAQHGPRAGRLLPGHPRRRPRRLPRIPCSRRWTCPRRSSSRSSRSTSPTGGATRCSSSATTTSRTPTQSVDVQPVDFGPLPADDWALDGATSGTGHARLVSPLGDGKHARRRRLRPGRHYLRVRARDRGDARRHRADRRDRVLSTTPRSSSSRSARPAKYVRAAVDAAPRRGRTRRLRAADHAVPVPERDRSRAPPAARAPSRSTRTTRARWSTTSASRCSGAARSQFIGGLSLDSSGFGIAPDLDGDVPARSTRHRGGASTMEASMADR